MFITKDGDKSLTTFLERPDDDNAVFFKLNKEPNIAQPIVKGDEQDSSYVGSEVIPGDKDVSGSPTVLIQKRSNTEESIVKKATIIGGIICLLLIINRHG